jgi:hypothetical protein
MKSGVTLYSFTPDFHAGRYTAQQLIARVGELGLGPGLELVGFQSLRGFPDVTDEQVRRFRELIERHELEPSCLACNVDLAVRSDRFLDEDEVVAYLEAQLEAAAKLGFPVVRLQNTATPAVIERLLRAAERLDIRLGMEIHSPSTVNSPWVLALRELYARLDSPYLGWIPDFGSCTTRLSPGLLEAYAARGVAAETLAAVSERWHDLDGVEFDAHEQIGRFAALAGGPYAMNLAVFAVGIHGHMDAADWAEIMPDVVHVHGKFFGFDADGNEPAVPHDRLLEVFANYDGYLSSEWEGWHWDETPDAFQMVRRHQEPCARA